MEPKFRLSPMMDSYVSQIPEDRNRHRLPRDNASGMTTRAVVRDRENRIKTVPPVSQRAATSNVLISVPDSEQVKTVGPGKQSYLRNRALPYVDVPPIKATL